MAATEKATVGQRIRRLRTIARLSMNEVGELTGNTKQTVINWELGRHTPSEDNLVLIYRALKAQPALASWLRQSHLKTASIEDIDKCHEDFRQSLLRQAQEAL
jgi:transcriptional regulator with XRE-family HTH domain